ncbi:hypothetical protein D3C72_900380 [compost metagenome]
MPTNLPENSQVLFNANAILERPHIAAAMMKVVSLCSEMDYRWAIVLAEILEAEAGAGVAMYNAVDNQAAKGRLLKAAGEKRLDGHYRKMLKTLIEEASRASWLRNQIAHGQWGGMNGDVDGIVLGEGRWASTAIAGLLSHQHGIESLLGNKFQPPTLQRFTIMDFEADARKIESLIVRQHDLTTAFKNYRRVIRNMVLDGTLDQVRQDDL